MVAMGAVGAMLVMALAGLRMVHGLVLLHALVKLIGDIAKVAIGLGQLLLNTCVVVSRLALTLTLLWILHTHDGLQKINK